MNLVLDRAYLTTCTMGVLSVIEREFYTIEKPWRNNEKFKSCIPEGTYECVSYTSDKFPDVWEIKEVPGRSDILIHDGNFEQDVEGCIAVGLLISKTYQMVINSDKAIEMLRSILPEKFTITIKTRSPILQVI